MLVRVRLSAPIASALPIELEVDARLAGELTSIAALEGLAIVRRNVAQPGTKLTAGDVEVEVLTAPIGDDPGGAGRSKTATVKLGGR